MQENRLTTFFKRIGIVSVITLIAAFLYAIPVFADELTVSITVPSGYDADKLVIERDGVPLDDLATSGHPDYTISVTSSTHFITAVQYNTVLTNSECYPVHMAVWEVCRVSNEPETYEAFRFTGFDDVLGYSGFAIRPASEDGTVRSGFRCTLKIKNEIKENGLIDDGEARFTVEEYGHLHILSQNWNDASKYHMTFNDMAVLSAPCYNRTSGLDAKIKVESGETFFANSVYNISDYNALKHFRGYIKLRKNTGETYVLYGPIVGRNPYYVADRIKNDPTKWDSYNGPDPAVPSPIQAYINTIIDTVTNAGPPANHKKALFIGDSIMMGITLKSGRTGENVPDDFTQVTNTPSRRIGRLLADRLGVSVDCTLIANGGATYSEPGVNGAHSNLPYLAQTAITQLAASSTVPDYIFLLAGVNDWAYENQGEGSHDDSAIFGEHYNGEVKFYNNVTLTYWDYVDHDQSYCIGIDRTIKRLHDEYPNAHIMVCSPLRAKKGSGQGTSIANGATGCSLSEYSYVQQAIANRYETINGKVHFVNFYDLILEPMGIQGTVPENQPNFATYFPDGVHPTQAAYDIVSNIVIDVMTSKNIIPAPTSP